MRNDRLAGWVHPTVRFFWGLGLVACLVFTGGWVARGALAFLGVVLALASGKRVSFPYFLFLIATIVIFNLLLPEGRVWLQLGPWAITEGAFFLGLGKGFTFSGLVFFSLASVSRDLRLPGRFGALWGQTFSWYEQLMDQRQALKPRALLMSIDRLLDRLYPTRPEGLRDLKGSANQPSIASTTPLGWVLVVGSLILSVALAVGFR